jgi:hypothetical protein
VEGSCEHSNEPPGSIKCWEVLDGCKSCDFSRTAQVCEVSQLDIQDIYVYRVIRHIHPVEKTIYY